jgi:hypothetical protein
MTVTDPAPTSGGDEEEEDGPGSRHVGVRNHLHAGTASTDGSSEPAGYGGQFAPLSLFGLGPAR